MLPNPGLPGRSLFASLLALVLLSGCAAPIQATRNLPDPGSLTEVNALLDGRSNLTLDLADGGRLTEVSDVVVSADAVQFRRAGGEFEFSVGRVERITYVRNRGVTAGTVVGAAPGLAILGFSGALFVASSSSESESAWVGSLAAIAGGMVGAGVLAIGAPLGAVVGAGVSPGGVVPLYEGPVERYLVAPTVPLRSSEDV